MAKNKKNDIKEEAVKKNFSTKEIVVVMIVVAIIAAGILVAVNIIKNQSEEKNTDGVAPDKIYNQIADSVKAMVREADTEIKYINTDDSTILYFVNENKCYGVKYVAGEQALYSFDSKYSANATTVDQKKIEAASIANNAEVYTKYATQITSFFATNANGGGEFADGTVQITLAVTTSEGVKRDTFSEKVPGAEVAE